MHNTKIEFLPVGELHFDRQNPRLAGYAVRGNTPEEEVIKTLWQEMAVDEVAMSIAASGFWHQEPLIVAQEGKRWVVVEGNRRLAAVRALREPSLAKEVGTTLGTNLSPEVRATLDELPVIKSTRQDSWRYLGFRHVNGPARWSSYAKADYTRLVHEKYGVPLEEIARQIGDKHRTVRRLYRALMVLQQAIKAKEFSMEQRTKKNLPFSHLYTALDYEGFQEFLQLRSEEEEADVPVPPQRQPQLGQVMTWLFGNRSANTPALVCSNRDLELLNKVLGSREACEALYAGVGLSDAAVLVDPPVVRLRASLLDAKTRLQTAYSIVREGHAGEEDIRQASGAVADLAGRLICELKMN